MKKTFSILAAAMMTLAAIVAPVPALAGDLVALSRTDMTTIASAIDDATAAYTNATTSYTDIAGVSFSVPATLKQYSKQYIRVCYFADATKATATTGIIGVYANGAIIAASERAIASSAGRSTMSSCYVVARSSAAAQTVKLQAKSGDTNIFTIAQLQASFELLYAY